MFYVCSVKVPTAQLPFFSFIRVKLLYYMTQFCPNCICYALCIEIFLFIWFWAVLIYHKHMATVLYILVHPIHVCCKCASL